jgi:dTDP-L-rhamnose 4-epimerase
MTGDIKKILVTGGAGFIGSHVVEELLSTGYQVRILDNLAPPTHDGNLPAWVNEKAEFLKGDATQKKDWLLALDGIDAVIHLAAYMDYHLDFSKYIRTNIESIALMFEVIVENKLPIKKIIAASSQSVYGEGKYKCPQHGELYPLPRKEELLTGHRWEQYCPQCGIALEPLPELENDVLSPLTPYGISKLASEQLLMNLGQRYGIPAVALRFSIVLGPNQSFRHFYSGALRAFSTYVLNKELIQMNEDAKQFRDFVHVRDVAKAHLVVLNDERADFQSFNVGSGQGTRVIELAKIVAEEGRDDFKPLLSDRYRVGDVRHSLMSVDKLKSLSWGPELTLRQAVGDYLLWIRQFGDLRQVLNETYDQLKKQGVIKH